ncbi:hypothetical protein GCM10011403_01030 [Pseudohongiella nitratireducens]|uniref:Uncharacterized protein n=1 Tax=Pseudohongiella nitratireducens TaxID=1768907 RepID=A0A917GJE3_9GAMM|nr:hypothetical protein GCM10011403_01030 [Pseudohongiella nitratireducens]
MLQVRVWSKSPNPFLYLGSSCQTRFDTIYTGSLSSPQLRDIYAPLDGSIVNGGINVLFKVVLIIEARKNVQRDNF